MFTPLGPDFFEAQGKRACIDGKYEYDNPHEEGTMQHTAWKAGYAQEWQAYLDSLEMTTLGAKLVSHPGDRYQRWQVAYDGRILGDDRGYGSEADALAEARRRIEKDQADARRYDRAPIYKMERR